MSDKSYTPKRNGNTSGYHNNNSGSASSLTGLTNRMKYSHLSPMSSYYKPLIRSFGKREDGDTSKVSRNFLVTSIVWCVYIFEKVTLSWIFVDKGRG